MSKKRQRTTEKPSLLPGVKLIHTLPVSFTVGSRIRWSPDGRILATPSGKHRIKLWDTQSGEYLKTLIGHEDRVTSVTFSPDGSQCASASRDATVRVWDLSEGICIAVLKTDSNPIEDVSWSKDGRFIAAAYRRGSVAIWDATSKMLFRKDRFQELGFSIGPALGLAWALDSARLAAGVSFAALLLDVRTQQPAQYLQLANGITDVVFSPDPSSKWLAGASSEHNVVIWDSLTGKKLMVIIPSRQVRGYDSILGHSGGDPL